MYLIKFLPKEFFESAIRVGAIRIGTINYYRKIEDETRKDANEGLGEVIWKGQKLSEEDHNRIFTFTEKMQLTNGWSIENKGVPLIGSYPNFNVYTFCLSQTNSLEKSDIDKISGGKAPNYYFITDLPEFVRVLREKIREAGLKFIENNKTDMTPELIDKLEVIDVVYGINYDDSSKARIVTEENVKDFNPTVLHTQDFFQKHSSFSYEQEVRIIWIFVTRDENGITPLSFPPSDIEHLDLLTVNLPISKLPTENNYPVRISPLKNLV